VLTKWKRRPRKLKYRLGGVLFLNSLFPIPTVFAASTVLTTAMNATGFYLAAFFTAIYFIRTESVFFQVFDFKESAVLKKINAFV
jgi:hypothetical protein